MESRSSIFADFLKSVETTDAIFYGIVLEPSDNRGLAHLLGLEQDPYNDLLTFLQTLRFNHQKEFW